MVRGLSRYNLVATLNRSLAAVIGIGGLAIAFIAAILRLLVGLCRGKTVKGVGQQKNCRKRHYDSQTAMHRIST